MSCGHSLRQPGPLGYDVCEDCGMILLLPTSIKSKLRICLPASFRVLSDTLPPKNPWVVGPELIEEYERVFCMPNLNFETEKNKVNVESRPDGSVSVKTTPKDFAATGAAEVSIGRARGDDGSVEVVISPKTTVRPEDD